MIESERELLVLLATIADTKEDELDCDAFLDRMAPLAERIHAQLKLSDAFFEEAHHLRVCDGCREEFEALLAALRAE